VRLRSSDPNKIRICAMTEGGGGSAAPCDEHRWLAHDRDAKREQQQGQRTQEEEASPADRRVLERREKCRGQRGADTREGTQEPVGASSNSRGQLLGEDDVGQGELRDHQHARAELQDRELHQARGEVGRQREAGVAAESEEQDRPPPEAICESHDEEGGHRTGAQPR
jgi:hypothetical protein